MSQDQIDFLLDDAAKIVNDSTQSYPNIIDRYYTRYYKPLTPAIISSTLFANATQPEVIEDPDINVDQYYFVHSNHLVLFGLSKKHDIFQKIREGIFDPAKLKISFDRKGKASKMEAASKVSGKKKLNATQLDQKTMICEIRCGWTDEHLASLPEPPKYDSKLYKPRALLDGAKIIEINERIIENP